MFDDPLAGELSIPNVLAPGETERGLDHFGDAQVCDHVGGLTGRYCQRGIRADERLSHAAINLDVESGDRDARVLPSPNGLAAREGPQWARSTSGMGMSSRWSSLG